MEPFLKWAGGKRWLTVNAKNNIPASGSFNRYFEPFLGSGAIFFYLKPENAVLSDVNSELINSYRVIRDQWSELNGILRRYNTLHCEEFYYQVRKSKPRTPLNKAARFIYLNRTCWNGLYRVNLKGEFNVPIGTKTKVVLNSDDFEGLSNLLQGIILDVSDFEDTINQAENGDFVFVDPPYTVKHNNNGFIKYNETLFSWEDQVRLKEAVSRAARRGAFVLVLNADHHSIRKLYADVGEMNTLKRSSVIAGDPNARGVYSELAIKCW